MHTAIKLFLGGLLFWSFAASAHPCVRQHFPPLAEVLEKRLSPAQREVFFEGWTEEECLLLYAKFDSLIQRASAPRMPSAEFLYAHYGTHVFGVFGEVFGSAWVRSGLEEGDHFLDELHYDWLNPEGKKPDGVTYRLSGDTLIITGVLESKMGGANYSARQAEGYLLQWQTNGIRIHPKAFYTPAFIQIQTAQGNRPIGEIREKELREITVLIGTTSNRSFSGKYIPLPFNATTARSMAYDYMVALLASLPHRPKEPSQVPVLRPEEVPDFALAIVDFIVEQGRWPKSGSQDGLEKFLAREISNRGGQATLFQRDLSPALRHFLTLYQSVPAISPLEVRILQSRPADEGAISTLRAYIRSYRRDHQIIPLVEKLRAQSPEWAAYFSQFPVDALRSADLEEVKACLELLSRYDTFAPMKVKPRSAKKTDATN